MSIVMAQWDSYGFTKATKLKRYINRIKKRFIGRELTGVHSMGGVFSKEDLDKYGRFEFDHPVVFDFEGCQLEVLFESESFISISVNKLTIGKIPGVKYLQFPEYYEWSDISSSFQRFIGHRVVDFRIKTFSSEGFPDWISVFGSRAPAGDDYIAAFAMVFDNGYVVDMSGFLEFMHIRIIDEKEL